jgi:hypothetical protein
MIVMIGYDFFARKIFSYAECAEEVIRRDRSVILLEYPFAQPNAPLRALRALREKNTTQMLLKYDIFFARICIFVPA